MNTLSISLLVSRLKENVINALTPLKGLTYFGRYFHLLEEITVHSNTPLRWSVYFNLAVVLYKSGHFLFLHMSKELSELEHALHYDVLHYLSSGKSSVQLMAFSVTLNVAYTVAKLHFGANNLNVNRILYRILFKGDLSLFSSPTWKGGNLSVRIRTLFLVTLNGLQLFIVIASKWSIFFVTRGCKNKT